MVPFVTEISTALEEFYFTNYYTLRYHTKYNMGITRFFTSPRLYQKSNKWAGNVKMDTGLADMRNSTGHRPLLHPGHVLLTFCFEG
jgi:hypothetical protein